MAMNALSYWQQLDLLVSQWKEQQRPIVKSAIAPKGPRTPMTLTEMMIVDKIQQHVRFPPATSPKRFIRRLTMQSELSDRGRQYLAWIAHRFRRQWQPTEEEFAWIVTWGSLIEMK